MTKKEICIIALLAVLIIGAFVAAACIRGNRQPERIIGEFSPPAFAQNTFDGAPAPAEVDTLPYGTLTLSEDISLSMVSTLIVDENGVVDIWLTAPDTNKGWVALRLMDEQGNILGESGVLKPGQYIRSMQLENVPQQAGIVLAKILTYEPEPWYSMGSASAQLAFELK